MLVMKRKMVSAIALTILLTSILILAFNIQPVKASGTIYIRADGSIDPPTAPIQRDGDVYTLTGNITSDGNGIIIMRSNVTIDGAGYTLQGIGAFSMGMYIESRSNVTIKNAKIKGFESGISFFGYTPALKFNKVVGNYIVNNSYGIRVVGDSYNIIAGNNILNNTWGVILFASSNNTIVGNNIIANDKGITLWDGSSNNSIFGNNMESNFYGIMLVYGSSNNKIFHNNFINNTRQADSVGYNNTWDDGYPFGGNYWSDYAAIDELNGPYQNITGSDGIGDTSHDIDENNIDRYPLMAPFTTFDAGTWNGTAYNVNVISNSTASNFQLNTIQKTTSFNVSGVEGTAGFCRITIPNIIVQELWNGNYTVLLNGEPCPFRNWTDTTNTYIYINYTHSQHQIAIIPEFPSVLFLPLLLVSTLGAVVLSKKRRQKCSREVRSIHC